MDPSAALCSIPPLTIPIMPGQMYSHTGQEKLTPQIVMAPITANPPPSHADTNKYNILQTAKDAFDNPNFLTARTVTNPFEAIGRSIFMNRAAIKLANIDAVHNITKEIFIFDAKTSARALTFCDIAAGPGGFTQYLQYRFPNSTGYGITLKHPKCDWNLSALDLKHFTPYYGPDNTGNLYTNWESFTRLVLKEQPGGVELVTADGGFDLEENGDKSLLRRQEFLSSRLLLTQCLVGIGCTKINGNFMVKVFDTVTDFSAQVLFILAQCFQSILIFKPVTSRPANSERYVICMNRKQVVHDYYQLLSEAARAYTDEHYITNLFSEPLPSLFRMWLYKLNNESIDTQLDAAQRILLYMKEEPVEIPSYNIAKFLTIWNLPDNARTPNVECTL